MSSFTLVNLFSGPDGNLPFYIRLPAGQSVSPGVYQADSPLKVNGSILYPQLRLWESGCSLRVLGLDAVHWVLVLTGEVGQTRLVHSQLLYCQTAEF